MLTPMQLQYEQLKKQYPDCILLFRLGDFYEGFDDDAKVLAKVLGIALTGRGKDEKRKPMAGIPYHALPQYLPKLVKAGYKVAIAEQLEEPQPGKIVDRNVIKIITAGTVTDEKNLISSQNNFLVCLYNTQLKNKFTWGFSSIDLTTGDFEAFEVFSDSMFNIPKEIQNEISKLSPNEILISENIKELFISIFKEIPFTTIDSDYVTFEDSRKVLLEQFDTKNLKGYGIDDLTTGIISAAEILKYLKDTQKTELLHIKKISHKNLSSYMNMDESTIRNLELVYSLNQIQNATVFEVLNKCQTSMGQRMLRMWLLQPLLSQKSIENRLDSVEYLFNNIPLTQNIRELLTEVYDIERIVGKIGLSIANARDLKSLQFSLEHILKLLDLDFTNSPELINSIVSRITNTSEINFIIDLIKNSIKDDPSPNFNEGEMILSGFDRDLDETKGISKNVKNEILEIQQAEITKTGINSLKIKYNSVFGYYIEISKSNISKVPDYFIRKQTLVNAERYITEDLKILEEKVLGAEDRIIKLEYDLFCKIRSQIAQYIDSIQEVSKCIATLDIISNFAYLATERHYSKPTFSDNEIDIQESRHIVIETLSDEPFISNDLQLDNKKNLMILTGPNMSGKSTFIRQIALISLVAQIGSFIPAKSAKLPVIDRIFTRVGASDNLVRGESTFMVEMNETANILNNATKNSLIILDEVGRGTSTYDGVALAWSITEFIHEKIGAFTLFATHYHELIELEKLYSKIINFNVEVKESNGKVTFMRKIIKGSTDKSYGIHVAKLAGIPNQVIERANEILKKLEDNRQSGSKKGLRNSKPVIQLSFVSYDKDKSLTNENEKESKIIGELKDIDINSLTPLDALKKLKDIKDMI
jgi:DNA mismatch repair protein MutS